MSPFNYCTKGAILLNVVIVNVVAPFCDDSLLRIWTCKKAVNNLALRIPHNNSNNNIMQCIKKENVGAAIIHLIIDSLYITTIKLFFSLSLSFPAAEKSKNGATTVSTMTLSIMTLGKDKDIGRKDTQHVDIKHQ